MHHFCAFESVDEVNTMLMRWLVDSWEQVMTIPFSSRKVLHAPCSVWTTTCLISYQAHLPALPSFGCTLRLPCLHIIS